MRNGKKFFVKDIKSDLHTQYGYLKKDNIAKAKDGEKIFSNTHNEFFVISPSFIDIYKKISRKAQIIPLKDIGFIIAQTGIDKNSVVVDAGAGSGALSCFLANIVKGVVTYEIREDFLEVVKNNIEFLGIKNIKIKNKNIFDGIDEKDVDLITLDLPDPWNAINACSGSLKHGGFIVSYSPTIPQVMDFVDALKTNGNFIYLKTSEIIEREWDVEDRKVRPKSIAIGHSGFLSVARRV